MYFVVKFSNHFSGEYVPQNNVTIVTGAQYYSCVSRMSLQHVYFVLVTL